MGLKEDYANAVLPSKKVVDKNFPTFEQIAAQLSPAETGKTVRKIVLAYDDGFISRAALTTSDLGLHVFSVGNFMLGKNKHFFIPRESIQLVSVREMSGMQWCVEIKAITGLFFLVNNTEDYARLISSDVQQLILAGKGKSGLESEESEMKTCPDCAELVKSAAKKCRFCGYRFDE